MRGKLYKTKAHRWGLVPFCSASNNTFASDHYLKHSNPNTTLASKMKTSAALILSFAVAALAAPAPAADPGSVEVIKETKEVKTVVKYVKYCYEKKCDFYYKDHGYNYYVSAALQNSRALRTW